MGSIPRARSCLAASTDTFARDRKLPHVEVDDVMMIRDVGAYGAVMASTYLRRPLPPEEVVSKAGPARPNRQKPN